MQVPYDDVVRHVQGLLLKGGAGMSRAAVQRQESLGLRSSSLVALGPSQSPEPGTDGTEQEDARPASWRERRRNRNK